MKSAFRTGSILSALAWVLMAPGVGHAQEPVRSAAEVDYPPFSVVDEAGRADGFAVELLRAALAAMDLEVTFRTGPWPEVRGWLERGEVDALPLVGRTPEREPLFDFTFPYMSLHGAIVVREGTEGIHTLEDLRGRQVAVMRGDNAEEFLRRQDRGFSLHTTDTYEDALRELAAGQHDAVVIQRLVGLRLVQDLALHNLRVLDRPIEGFRQDFSFGVVEGDDRMLAILNEGLAVVMADGTYRQLHAKWFAGLQLPTDRPILIGGDHNYPPFEFLDENGRPTGFMVDLTRAIAREMNLDVRFHLAPWPEVVDELVNGQIDVVQGMFYTPERDRTLDFSPPHMVSHYVSVVRRGTEPPQTLDDLQDFRLVAQTGDPVLETLAERGLASRVSLVESQEGVLRSVMEGDADCGLVVRMAALHLMEAGGWEALRLGSRPLLQGEYSFAVREGEDALLSEFVEGLRVLEASGEYREIQVDWFGSHDPGPPGLLTVLRYSAMFVLPLLLVLAGVFFWSWSLRRQVTEQTHELRESADLFRSVFESANVGKSLTEPTGEIRVNQAFADFLGYSREELRGTTWQEITPPEEVEEIQKTIAPLLKGQAEDARFPKRYLRKDGTAVWADVSVAMRRAPDGSPLHFVTTVVDIDDQVRAQQDLRESEEFQRALIACSPVALFSIDPEGRVLSWNPSAEGIFGWPEEEVLGRHLPIVPGHSQEEFRAFREEVLGGEAFLGREVVRQRKDGRMITISLSVAPIQDEDGTTVAIMSAAEDISERKALEAQQEQSKFILENLLEVARRLTLAPDFATVVDTVTVAARSLSGAQGASIILREGDQGHHAGEDAQAPLWKGTRFPLSSCLVGRVIQSGEWAAVKDVRADERVSHTLYRDTFVKGLAMAPIRVADPVGAIGAYWHEPHEATEVEKSLLGALGDMTATAWDALEARQSLRHSEETLRAIFENMNDGALVLDLDSGKFAIANSAICRNLGFTPDEIRGMGVDDIHPPEELPRIRKILDRQARGEIRLASEVPLLRKDGSVYLAEVSAATLEMMGHRHILSVFRDMTERKQAEEDRKRLEAQLVQAQKLESVGRLAGGVAHDFNNILGVIIGHAELALREVSPTDPLREDLSEILSAARRSSDITRQLLAFARRETIEPEVLDLNEATEKMLKMLRRLIGEDIHLAWRPGFDLWPVKMDPSQLDQILANLCVNARDAIADVGTVTIETGNVTLDPTYCEDHPYAQPGDFVTLQVTDDGRGMDQETLERVFEPFFTTKEMGRGTGLGLATIYGIVKQNEGFIHVYSEVEEGTAFRIYLPREAHEAPSEAKAPVAEPKKGRGETLLVVEDDPQILQLAGRVLERLGYRVLLASTPSEARKLAREHQDSLKLLITDVVMPEMNGRDLAETIRRFNPKLECLFMSGYTADTIARRGVLDEGLRFIQKPFSTADLAAKVSAALDAADPGE